MKITMNILILFSFLLLPSTLASYTHQNCTIDGHQPWICKYMKTHQKIYQTTEEMDQRKSKLMDTPISGLATKLQFGLTSRSDRFKHELKRNMPLKMSLHKQIERSSVNKHIHLNSHYKLPPIDWRSHHGVSYVTSVKDQGGCGDCFAFSSATVLEYWSKTYGHPKSLSAQSIMDCTSGFGRPDVGCEGGLMEYVFEYAKNHPVALDSEIPYQQKQQQCPRQLLSHIRVHNYKVLMHEENAKAEHQFEAILHKYGPISVGIDSGTLDNYKGGILTSDKCGQDIDHAVTIVGYTKDAWIIKNSWGKRWGEHGYLLLEKGVNACGVAEYAVYVSHAEPEHEMQYTKWSFSEF